MQKHSWILLAAATIGLTASQALAADLPRKAPQQHRRLRLLLLGPDVISVPTSAGFLAAAMRISILLKSVQTSVLALLAAVRLAATINSPADG
jgi:hypothetical protein